MAVTGFKIWDSGGVTTINAPTSSGCDVWDSGGLFVYNPASGATVIATVGNTDLEGLTANITAQIQQTIRVANVIASVGNSDLQGLTAIIIVSSLITSINKIFYSKTRTRSYNSKTRTRTFYTKNRGA